VGGGAIDHYLLLAQAAAANSAVAHAGTDRQTGKRIPDRSVNNNNNNNNDRLTAFDPGQPG